MGGREERGALNTLPRIFKRWRLDRNERRFIRDSPYRFKSEASGSKRVILIQMPMDYFYVLLFSQVGQGLAQQVGGIRIGLWPYNIFAYPRLEGMTALGRATWKCLQAIFQFLERRKWSKVYRGIGIEGDIWLDQVGYLRRTQNEQAAQLVWSSLKSKRQLVDLALNDVHCGDLIYDTYIRFRRKPTVKLDDPYLRYLIEQCLNAQARIREYFATHEVAGLLSSYVGGYIQHGIPAREALRSGIAVYAADINAKNIKRLDSRNPLHTANFEEYERSFSSMPDKAGKLALAKRQLEGRFSGQIDDPLWGMKVSAYADNDHPMPAGIDGVVFLQDFFDTPHCYRWMLFEDFWEWAVFTLRVIREHGLKIAVKPHPGQIPENDEVVRELKKEFPQIVWLDAHVSNSTIFKAGIRCGISVHGSVLHELAYHRIAALAAGDNPHIAFDFVRTPSTVAEYEHLLINYKTLCVSDDVQEKVLAFYYMHNMHDIDVLSTEAPKFGLREFSSDDSESLIKYLDKIESRG